MTTKINLTTVALKDGRTCLKNGNHRIADYVLKNNKGNIIVRSVLGKTLLESVLNLTGTKKSKHGYDKYQFALTSEKDLEKAIKILSREYSAEDLQRVYADGKPEKKQPAAAAKKQPVVKKTAAKKSATTKR